MSDHDFATEQKNQLNLFLRRTMATPVGMYILSVVYCFHCNI